MGQATYLVILLITIAGPVIATILSRRLRLTRLEWGKMLLVFVCVSVPFVLLDVLQHARGWWSYNTNLVFDGRLFGLPLEEVAFFFAIPFSSLYLYSHLAKVPSLQKPISLPQRMLASIAMLAVVVLAVVEAKERTVVDALLCLIVISTTSLLITPYQLKRHDIVWVGAIALLFLVVNGLLTSLPIVMYDSSFGSSLRLGSIPLADGVYNVSLLLSALFVYRYHRRQVDHLSSPS